jgi:DNA-binding response OmpR family regulator
LADVLIVEDEQSLLHTLRYNLSRAGHDVRLCTDGGRALEIVRENPPDLMLLDLMLPGLDGLEICRVLRREAATPRSVSCQF